MAVIIFTHVLCLFIYFCILYVILASCELLHLLFIILYTAHWLTLVILKCLTNKVCLYMFGYKKTQTMNLLLKWLLINFLSNNCCNSKLINCFVYEISEKCPIVPNVFKYLVLSDKHASIWYIYHNILFLFLQILFRVISIINTD